MRLLITVAGPAELGAALLWGGADLVDVKDPAAGSLGAPSPGVVLRVARLLPSGTPLSVPLGDSPDLSAGARGRLAAFLRARPAYVKTGLLGCDARAARRVLAELAGLVARFSPATRLVAVTFADAPAGGAPVPDELPGIADEGGAAAAMLDTLGKRKGRGLLDHLGRGRLRRWVAACHAAGLEAALAGGLDGMGIRRLGGVPVDVVGVRSAACGGGGRRSALDPLRCRRLRDAVRSASRRSSGSPRSVTAREETARAASASAGRPPGDAAERPAGRPTRLR